MKNSSENTGHSFDAYFKRALSPLVVLELISDQEKYVYEISSEMKERSEGRFSVAVLYPVLYRLEEQGYAKVTRNEVVNNRVRSYYCITDAGREYLAKGKQDYRDMKFLADLLLGEGENQ